VLRGLVAVAVVVLGVAGCANAPTTPRAAAHLTIDGATHTTRPAQCSQLQGYRTIDIRDRDSQVEAVVLLSGYRAIPQWVKIRNFGGFTGSFWQGGVGDAHVDLSNSSYTITGSAYGINTSNPNKVITTDFKLTADC
jgi:Mycobacterium 19 kDa lipoprotein antigen